MFNDVSSSFKMQVRTLCVAVLHLRLHSAGLFSVVKSAIIIQTSAYISLQTKFFFEPIAHYLVQNGALFLHFVLLGIGFSFSISIFQQNCIHTKKHTRKRNKLKYLVQYE